MRPEEKASTKRPDKFKRWMIASLFLIPLALFVTPLGYHYFYRPVKMKVLIQLLRYGGINRWASKMLFNQGEEAVPHLIHSLSDKNAYVRAGSVRLLISLGPRKGVDYEALLPHLKRLASDPEDLVRHNALWALGEIRSEEAVGLLIKCLSDPDRLFRINAAHTLGRTGSKVAVVPLIQALYERDVSLRTVAAEALGKIGSSKAVAPLIATLKEEAPPQARPIQWTRFRRAVIEALESITGRSLGNFRRATTDDERQEIIQQWLEWWKENKEEYEQPERDAPKPLGSKTVRQF